MIQTENINSNEGNFRVTAINRYGEGGTHGLTLFAVLHALPLLDVEHQSLRADEGF